MCRSVPQMEAASTWIRTSPGPGAGTGISTSSAPGADRVFRRARIEAGTEPAGPGEWRAEGASAPWGSRPTRAPRDGGGPGQSLSGLPSWRSLCCQSRSRSPTTEAIVTDNDHAHAAEDLAQRFWEDVLRIEPMVGTYIGDDRYDDRLPDPSEEGLAKRRSMYEGARTEGGTIDQSALDVDLRTTLDILESGCYRQLEAIEHRLDRFEAVTHLFGPSNLLADLGSLQRADTPERLEKYEGRLAAIPTYLQGIEEVADGAVRDGQVVPELVIDRTIGQVERLLQMKPEESPAMNPVGDGTSGDDRQRIAGLLRDEVWPAYQSYLEALRRYR